MDIEEKLVELMPIIKRVARRVASETHIVEAEDLEQELALFVVKRGESIPAPSEVKWSLQGFLTKIARTYAFEQRQQHFLANPEFCYEVKDVREILQTHFDVSNWDAVRQDQTVEDAVAAHSDIAWALHQLTVAEKEFVANCYMAERLPMSGTKEYRKLRDLIIKICNMVNHYTRSDEGKGPGRRKAISNSSAGAVIDACGHPVSIGGKVFH